MTNTQSPRGSQKKSPTSKTSIPRNSRQNDPTPEPRGLRTKAIGVRVREEEFTQFDEAAEALGIRVGAWFRVAGLEKLRPASAALAIRQLRARLEELRNGVPERSADNSSEVNGALVGRRNGYVTAISELDEIVARLKL